MFSTDEARLEPLAAQLRELATTRGILVDEVGRQALAAGLAALDVPADATEIVDLGPINLVPPTMRVNGRWMLRADGFERPIVDAHLLLPTRQQVRCSLRPMRSSCSLLEHYLAGATFWRS